MAFPKYFRDFPNLQYTFSVNKAGKPEYLTIKDFFHRLKVRDDILREKTLYTSYYIQNGKRPDQISYELYGDEQYYWIILQINDIVDYYSQWPLTTTELDKYILKKYGSYSNASLPHHWETVETFDDDGNLVLPGGLRMSSNFSYTYRSSINGAFVEKVSLPVMVTNYEYEQSENEKKKNIFVLNERYINDFIRETTNYARNLPTDQRSEVDISSYFQQ
jgi:hypothetical protein